MRITHHPALRRARASRRSSPELPSSSAARLPRPQLLHFTLALNPGHRRFAGITRHVDEPLMATGIVLAIPRIPRDLQPTDLRPTRQNCANGATNYKNK